LDLVVKKFLPDCKMDPDAINRLSEIKKESRDRWLQILKERN
jgi:hypothetical protein